MHSGRMHEKWSLLFEKNGFSFPARTESSVFFSPFSGEKGLENITKKRANPHGKRNIYEGVPSCGKVSVYGERKLYYNKHKKASGK